MLRKSFSAIMLMFMSVGLVVFASSIQRVEAAIITVPDNHLTILEAISHANAGDTIIVRNGTYNEELTLEKSLTLIGDNKLNTIIEELNVSGLVEVHLTNFCVNQLSVKNSSSVWASGCRFVEASVGSDAKLLISQSEAWDVHAYEGGQVLGFYDLPLFGKVVFSLPFGFIIYVLPVFAACAIVGILVVFYVQRRKRKAIEAKQ